MEASDWQDRVARLPLGHAVALRLHAAGHGDDVIATALGLPVESVPTLLEVAHVKLEHATLAGEDPTNQWPTTEAGPDEGP